MNTREQVAVDSRLDHPYEEAKPQPVSTIATSAGARAELSDQELAIKLDAHSLEDIVEIKISRFLEQLGTFYPDDLHTMIMQKVEKPLLKQILLRTGGNQVHAARILGINRNTLRKKMKMYGL